MQSKCAGSLAPRVLGISAFVLLAASSVSVARAQEDPEATTPAQVAEPPPDGTTQDAGAAAGPEEPPSDEEGERVSPTETLAQPAEENADGTSDEASEERVVESPEEVQPAEPPAETTAEPTTSSHAEAHGAAAAAKESDGVLGGLVSLSHGNIQIAGIRVNGRFDIAYEMGNFALDGAGDPQNSIKNYHHFIFLSRNEEDEWFSFNAEIIDLSFYEVALKLGYGMQLRFGKVLIPFGADPLFHRSYGGVSGIDQKLLPFVWAEHGAVFEANIFESDNMSLDNELFVVSGVSGSEDQVLKLSGASDMGTVALGNRLRFGFDKFAASVSIYWDRYAGDYNMLIWGGDFSAAYGFLPWPYLDRLAVKMGFLRADIQGSRASGLLNYYHFGSYLQLDYRLPWTMGVRYRTGMVAMENHRGFFFDDRPQKKASDDTLAHSFTVWKRYRGFSLAAELIINIEAAGEVDNDLFRLTAAIDF